MYFQRPERYRVIPSGLEVPFRTSKYSDVLPSSNDGYVIVCVCDSFPVTAHSRRVFIPRITRFPQTDRQREEPSCRSESRKYRNGAEISHAVRVFCFVHLHINSLHYTHVTEK